ncbi:hypothetical protein K443DRAFT_566421 [Laccaria amethystina LaAM-08-1]|uniref:Uncharacterized protein n=1 Tax=Laccaria amethystina LaAM-08-1 TaxID=1095629 RepID=A0A0C9WGX6_9AGAR|nr:hypothetical protein K443DRAFT_566421 [Laccaria amethystina LaAM-08-1]
MHRGCLHLANPTHYTHLPASALHNLGVFHSSPIRLKYPTQSQRQVKVESYRDVGSSHKKEAADRILTPTMRTMRGQVFATKTAS